MTVAEVANLGLASHGLGLDSPNIALDSDSQNHRADAIVVADAHLLFTGDFRRTGSDLVISKDDRQFVIDDYFKGEKRAALASRDGAMLSGTLVEALSGDVQYAQAAGGTLETPVIGTCSKLGGFAEVIRNGVSLQLHIGDNVNKGDVVQTGANSSLVLVFIDGSVFGLAASSRMLLNEMIYDPNSSSNSSLLSLIQGTITLVAGETAKRGDMRVETPAATMGIRGTAVLVEIDFVVPGSGAAAPVRFQLLVEPGGVTGSLALYSRTSPTTAIGQVSQSGQVTSVTGTGELSTYAAPPLSPATQAIVDQTMREYFPNYNPRTNNPSSGSSSPPEQPNPGFQTDPIDFQGGRPPAIGPLRIDFRPPGVTDDFIPVITTRLNTPPQINVSDVLVALDSLADSASFNIGDRVSISDPDFSNTFNDVPVPYVAGTARLVAAAGPPSNAIDLARLIAIDAETGAVDYDPASFAFLAQGATVSYTIAFDSRSGPDTLHRTLTLTIVGVNDGPVVTSASLAVEEGGSVVLTAADIGVSDPDGASFTFTILSVTHGRFETFRSGAWISTAAFTSAELAAGHVRFTHDGGEDAPAFSLQASDGLAASSGFAGTIGFSPVNDVPVAFADTNWARADSYASIDGNVILGAGHSPDEAEGNPPSGNFADVADTDAESDPLTVSAVNGSSANVGQPLCGAYGTLILNADGSYTYVVNDAAVRGLGDGETAIDQFSYTVTDGAATSAGTTLTITVFGNNDAPVAKADTNWAREDLHTAIDGNVILGANHSPDNTEGNPPSGTFADRADTDADGEPLTVNAVNGFAANVGNAICGTWGTLTLSASGAYTYVVDDAAVQGLDDCETVTDQFTYTVTDGAATSNTAMLTITVFGSNDAPSVVNTQNWMPSDPCEQAAGEPGYPQGYPLLVGVPDDVDGENVTVTATGQIPAGVCYFDGSCYVPLTTGTLLYDPSACLNLLDDLVYRPTASDCDTVNLTLSLDVFDGTVHVTQTVGIHEVVETQAPIGTWHADPGIVVDGDPVLADQIYGTSANDTLAGNGGDDVIDGRGGCDLLFGGGGADNFKFAACEGHAVIGDFTPGQDRIDLSAIVAADINAWIASHVAASPTNPQDTLICVDDNLTITLRDVLPSSLSGSDFIVHPIGGFN